MGPSPAFFYDLLVLREVTVDVGGIRSILKPDESSLSNLSGLPSWYYVFTRGVASPALGARQATAYTRALPMTR